MDEPLKRNLQTSKERAAKEKALIDMVEKLPKPACRLGYTIDQVVEIMDSFPEEEKGDNLHDFNAWMSTQTGVICNGLSYNYATQKYVDTDCRPNGHGWIVYEGDVRRFLLGLPIVD